MNNDKKLLNIICTKNKDGKFSKLKKNVLNIYFNDEEVYNYVKNRYTDISSTDDKNIFYEVVYRIRNNIDIIPRCIICNKPVRFHHCGNQFWYSNDCSRECRYKILKIKRDKTIKEKYGVDNPYQLESVKADIRKKLKERYGGYTWERSSSTYNKFKNTMIERYGVENPMHSEICLKRLENTFIKKYGVTSPWINKDIWMKCFNTQNKNKKGTLYSMEENRIYDKLCLLYGKDNVVRQYKSKDYPYNCDFYISTTDTYIEYNGYWTHGSHPYNKNNIKDIITKVKIIRKYNNDPQWIWWTKDVEKINCAKRNNLNYIMWYNMKEFECWFNKQINKNKN